jgi:hypothetical protein
VAALFTAPPADDITELRVISYLYEFTTAKERAETGNWWRRTDPKVWLRPVRLVR